MDTCEQSRPLPNGGRVTIIIEGPNPKETMERVKDCFREVCVGQWRKVAPKKPDAKKGCGGCGS